MASFGIDPTLLVINEVELARLRASRPIPDFRQAGNLEHEIGNKQENLRDAEARLAEASRAVVELLGNLKSVEAAHKRLEKIGGSPAKLTQKICDLRDELKSEQQREIRLTAIVASLKANISQFLAEGPKDGSTNGEMINSGREREKALKAAGF